MSVNHSPQPEQPADTEWIGIGMIILGCMVTSMVMIITIWAIFQVIIV